MCLLVCALTTHTHTHSHIHHTPLSTATTWMHTCSGYPSTHRVGQSAHHNTTQHNTNICVNRHAHERRTIWMKQYSNNNKNTTTTTPQLVLSVMLIQHSMNPLLVRYVQTCVVVARARELRGVVCCVCCGWFVVLWVVCCVVCCVLCCVVLCVVCVCVCVLCISCRGACACARRGEFAVGCRGCGNVLRC